MSFLAHHHARRRLVLPGPPPLIWQENNPNITYGNGVWVQTYFAGPYGGGLKYAITNGSSFQFLVPEGGYTRCILEGYQDVNSNFFKVYRDNVEVLKRNAFSATAQLGTYFDLDVRAGELLRVEFIGEGTNTGDQGGNNAMYADQLRFT